MATGQAQPMPNKGGIGGGVLLKRVQFGIRSIQDFRYHLQALSHVLSMSCDESEQS